MTDGRSSSIGIASFGTPVFVMLSGTQPSRKGIAFAALMATSASPAGIVWTGQHLQNPDGGLIDSAGGCQEGVGEPLPVIVWAGSYHDGISSKFFGLAVANDTAGKPTRLAAVNQGPESIQVIITQTW